MHSICKSNCTQELHFGKKYSAEFCTSVFVMQVFCTSSAVFSEISIAEFLHSESALMCKDLKKFALLCGCPFPKNYAEFFFLLKFEIPACSRKLPKIGWKI